MPATEPPTVPPTVPPTDDVVTAARARAAALRRGDRFELAALLHPDFTWTAHDGTRFDRDSYVSANCGGGTSWHDQQLDDVVVTEVGRAAVLTAVVTDLVSVSGELKRHRMHLTMTWVRDERSAGGQADGVPGGSWRCLAGHAGPRVDSQP